MGYHYFLHLRQALDAVVNRSPVPTRLNRYPARSLHAAKILSKGRSRVAFNSGTSQPSALLVLGCTNTVSFMNIDSNMIHFAVLLSFRFVFQTSPRVELLLCYLTPNCFTWPR